MYFKRSHTTNQRIERITMKTAVVGIDIAKDIHVHKRPKNPEFFVSKAVTDTGDRKKDKNVKNGR